MWSPFARGLPRTALVALWTVGVCSCGGGGGGGSPDPVLGATAFTTNENVALSVSLTANDPGGGTVTFTQTGNPTSGAVSNLTTDGKFTYTPNPNFTGSDSFGIVATDTAGNKTTGTVTITVTVNKPPLANNTAVRSDNGLSIQVLSAASASDPDKDPLTVTITDPALYGTAVANSDGTVNINGLSGFKGLTRFGFTVTDPSGATASAHMAVFVGTDPFRATFAGDAAGDGSNEVYLTDFAADPVVVTKATQGSLRLKGFAASDNGATVVYRTQDTTAATTMHLAFVQTKTPTQDVAIPLPNGLVPIADANGKDQFVVSPDGQWIALVAGQAGGNSSLYVVNVTRPTVVSPVAPSGGAYATQPTFSPDSKNIYFLATTDPTGKGRSLYFASLSNPATVALVSFPSDPATSDDVTAYSVAPDQSRVLEQANRGGRIGLFFIDTTKLTTEVQLNAAPPFGMLITGSTVGLTPGQGGSVTVARVAYTVGTTLQPQSGGAYVAEVSGTSSNPRQVAPSVAAIGLRPDDKALLYTNGSLVSEAVIDSGAAATSVGGGNLGWYDSTGNIVLLRQSLQSGLSNYPALAATTRGSFGVTQQVGTTSMQVNYVDTSGFDRGVALIGQGAVGGSAPASVQLQLVSALAPTSLFTLASFQTPVQLTSNASKIVATSN